MVHFISIRERQKTDGEYAKVFMQNIWNLHRLPSSVILDSDPMFTRKFWVELMGGLDIRLRKSIAFHPQTDGQTKRVNQSLEHYLYQSCNYEQDNWFDLLPLAEYAYNNSATKATRMVPLYANYGFHPGTTYLVEKESKNPASRNYAHLLESVHDLYLKYVEEICKRMGKCYDRGGKEPPPYGVGDLVLLNGKHIRMRRAAKKYDAKLFGLFKVKKQVGPEGQAVEFELPS